MGVSKEMKNMLSGPRDPKLRSRESTAKRGDRVEVARPVIRDMLHIISQGL